MVGMILLLDQFDAEFLWFGHWVIWHLVEMNFLTWSIWNGPPTQSVTFDLLFRKVNAIVIPLHLASPMVVWCDKWIDSTGKQHNSPSHQGFDLPGTTTYRYFPRNNWIKLGNRHQSNNRDPQKARKPIQVLMLSPIRFWICKSNQKEDLNVVQGIQCAREIKSLCEERV